MDRLALDDFDPDAFDAMVLRTPDADPFCSASDWILSAREAWSAGAETWVHHGEYGYGAFLRLEQAGGFFVLHSFDTMWGFSCPLIGARPKELAKEWAEHCRAHADKWDFLVINGLIVGSRLFRALVEQFEAKHTVYECAQMRRWRTSLEAGLDGFLAQRSPKFRQTLRAALRKSEALGIEMEIADSAPLETVFQRILAIEGRSWKGPERTGLLSFDMLGFYRQLADRVARRGGLRVLFARHEDADIGYVLGGVFADTYRGFQFSYDNRYAQYSIGNVMQYRQIRDLCAEGVRTYDLGIDMDYKRRWAEVPMDTVSLAVMRV